LHYSTLSKPDISFLLLSLKRPYKLCQTLEVWNSTVYFTACSSSVS